MSRRQRDRKGERERERVCVCVLIAMMVVGVIGEVVCYLQPASRMDGESVLCLNRLQPSLQMYSIASTLTDCLSLQGEDMT